VKILLIMGESRSVFQFKQFQLAHGSPGLKITTEACLFGAWAQQFASGNVLDIGTGCGLLACMIAQQNPNCTLTGLEIQAELAVLARENVVNLPYSIEIITESIQSFTDHFDFIISNPPFFIDHLANPNASKQLAMHADNLSPAELADGISKNLNSDGQFAVLYPPFSMKQFELEANKLGLFINQVVEVKHQKDREILRVMALGSHHAGMQKREMLCIKNPDQTYAAEFSNLLKPYYLIFD
jgi:tRNA1Val (adenine37-N6)-methyltransferase